MNASPEEYQFMDMQARTCDLYALAKYEIILEWLRPYSSLKILNVGCGSGELSLLLAMKGHQVLGIDPNENYIEIAHKLAKELNLTKCAFQSSSLESYSDSEKFDVVVASDVIEHIQEDRKALKKMASLIKPHGHLIITVPAGEWLFGYHDQMLGHFRRYSFHGLKKLLLETIQIEELRYFGFFLIPVCFLYSKLLRKNYPVAECGDPVHESVSSRLLKWVLEVEKKMRFPAGTSLLALGRPAHS